MGRERRAGSPRGGRGGGGGCMRQPCPSNPPGIAPGFGAGSLGGSHSPAGPQRPFPAPGFPTAASCLPISRAHLGDQPPPPHTQPLPALSASPPPPLNAGHCSHGSPQGQAEPPGVLLPLQDAHPEPDPAAAFPPPSCIPWAVLLLSPPPSPSSTLFRLPSVAGGLELDPKEPSTPPNPPQCSPT